MADKPDYSGHSETTRKELEYLDVRREELLAAAEVTRLADEAKVQHPGLGASISVQGWSWNPTAKATITVHAPRVRDAAPLLRWLGERDLRQTKPHERDAAAKCITWHLGPLDVMLSLTDPPSGRRCSYVKVGERTIVEPIYELRCEGEEPAAPTTEQAAAEESEIQAALDPEAPKGEA